MIRTLSFAAAALVATVAFSSAAWAGCAGHQQTVENTEQKTVLISKPVATPAPEEEKEG